MALRRILLTGDAFRTVAGEPAQLGNVRWLEQVLGPTLRAVAGLPVEIAYPLVGDSVAGFVALQGGEVGLDGWARLFWSSPSAALVQALRARCAGALVVSIETPPVLQRALDQAGAAWIDVVVSPLRFLPDWVLHLRASSGLDLHGAPDQLLIPLQIAEAVAHVGRWYGAAPISEPTLVFFAQTEQDRTLIRDGGFCGPAEALDGVRKLRRGRPVLVKPHPWAPDAPVVQALVEEAGARRAEAETYALLANPLVEVVTLSSSVGREARAFGREATILSPRVQDWACSGVDALRGRSVRLWSAILASAGVEVRPAPDPEWRPNELRSTLGGQGLDLACWREEASGVVNSGGDGDTPDERRTRLLRAQ